MSDQPTLATADDFRQSAGDNFEPPEPVLLPHLKKHVLLRRPRPMWFMLHQLHKIPQQLAGIALGEDAATVAATVDVRASLQWLIDIVFAVMVSPKVSLTPGANEIHPSQIHEDDINFIGLWAAGMKQSDGGAGTDLDSFRNERARTVIAPGENGRAVGMPSE